MTDFETLKFLADIGSVLVALTALFFSLRRGDRSHWVSRDSFAALAGRVDDLQQDLAELKAASAHAPTHRDMAELRREIGAVATAMAGIGSQLSALQTSVSMIQESLLRKGGGREP